MPNRNARPIRELQKERDTLAEAYEKASRHISPPTSDRTTIIAKEVLKLEGIIVGLMDEVIALRQRLDNQ